MPHLDPVGLQYFKDAMSRCSCLLEYGSGGSTVNAANVANVPAIVSVETDGHWVARVREAIHPGGKRFVEHCDVGFDGPHYFVVEQFWQFESRQW